MNGAKLVVTLVAVSVIAEAAVPLTEFFPYGTDKGDQTVSKNDDSSTAELTISVPFSYFGKQSRSLWVNTNGAISFASVISKYTPSCEPVEQSYSMVSPFWGDVDTRFYEPGLVYYRETRDPADLGKCTREINRAFPSLPHVRISWAYIATWHRVTFFGAELNSRPAAESTIPENTFQMALASDGGNSFAIFYYNQITWTTGTASDGDKIKGLGGEPARSGFDSGDGEHYYIIPGSCTGSILNLPQQSNVGSAGKFVFRIDTQDIIQPSGITWPVTPPTTGEVCSGHGRCVCDYGFHGNDCGTPFRRQTTTAPPGRAQAWHCKNGSCEKCDHINGNCNWPYFTDRNYCQTNCRSPQV